MGQTFVRHAGHSEENEGIPWQGDLTSEGREGEVKRYTYIGELSKNILPITS